MNLACNAKPTVSLKVTSLAKGLLQSRISRDVDFAVLIPAKDEYRQVRNALQQKGFCPV